MPYADPERQRQWARESARRRRADDPEPHRAASRKWYAEHRDQVRASQAEHRRRQLAEAARKAELARASQENRDRARQAIVCARCGIHGHERLCRDCREVLSPTERARWR